MHRFNRKGESIIESECNWCNTTIGLHDNVVAVHSTATSVAIKVSLWISFSTHCILHKCF